MHPPRCRGLGSRYVIGLGCCDLDVLFLFVFRLCGVYPSKEEAETSDCEGDIDGRPDGSKRMKMRDLDSVLGVKGESACSGLSGLRFLDLGLDRLILHLRVGEQGSTKMTGLTVDLNSIATSSRAEHDLFYPYKKLGRIKPADASESGSTTGPVEESEPLRVWKEMKQNGFLSSSHGSILMPKQQESWLKQVQEMQLHCENGLKIVSSGASSHLNVTHDSRFVNFSKLLSYIFPIWLVVCSKMKKSESTEREYAVQAAAASIYSTCNLIMTRGNVQCF
ncbi:hypothetical protein B296_00055045 [Ensete ventricosum]|uniref:Uncharacterized protein n=1 Tax=Ensete ventricosum TaxID=4639 RepID=A0A426X0M2_ENSVE|nr:hypothetical protein B296_00055045 [Ensete ventricosum]